MAFKNMNLCTRKRIFTSYVRLECMASVPQAIVEIRQIKNGYLYIQMKITNHLFPKASQYYCCNPGPFVNSLTWAIFNTAFKNYIIIPLD